MVYAQFYHPSAIDSAKQVEACGDRSVIIIDGRLSLLNKIKIAYRTMLLRGYNDFDIRKADGFNLPFTILYKCLLEN